MKPPEERLLHELIGDLAATSPDRPALIQGARTATFAELWAMSGNIASVLVSTGLKRGEIVALGIPRSIELVAAALGVLRAGGVVFGLDLNAPAHRNERLVAASGARRAVTCGSSPAWLRMLEIVDVLGAEAAPRDPAEVSAIDPASAAFLVFTSGSSGDPKGVLLSHEALRRRVDAERSLLASDPDTVYLYRTRTDLIGFPINLAIRAIGVAMVIVPEERGDDPRTLLALIEEHGVTHVALPPRLLKEVLKNENAVRSLRSLRFLRCSGEPLPDALADAVLAALPNCRLRDDYGATETSGVVAHREVSRAPDARFRGSSAAPHAILRIVDDQGADAESGELWVEGPLLAIGYLRGEDEARERFIVAAHEGRERRFYRTGDRAERRPDGTIRILGRMDLTLNVDGVRIDPAEIEGVLRTHPSIRDAAAWAHPDRSGRLRLVAYVIDRDAPETTVSLRAFVSSRLPPTHVPSRLVRVAALPLTSSGKVDRKALPAPAMDRAPSDPGADETERRLLEIFRRVLDEPGIGASGDFFEWGGDSLKAVALVSEVNAAFNRSLPAATLLVAPTVRELAKEVRMGTPASTVWMRKSGDREPLVCIPGLAGDPLWFLPLMACLDARRPLLGLSLSGLEPPLTIPAAVAAASAAIRGAQPRGPYLLVGHSVGGVVAFEAARALRAAGERIAFVGLIDTYVPGANYVGPGGSTAALKHRFRRARNQLARFYARQRNLFRRSVGARVETPVSFTVPGLRAATLAHRIEPADLAITFFRAKERPDQADLSEAWRPLARGGVEVVDVAGDHFDLVGDARADVLATHIADAIRRATGE